MIKPPSLQKPFTLIFSGDPALVLPEDPKERAKALEVARDTGVWEPLLKVGEKPTLFEIVPMSTTARHWIGQLKNRGAVTETQIAALSLRLSLRKLENFGTFTLRHEERELESGDRVTLATADLIDELGKLGLIGEAIVVEIGMHALIRAMSGIPPKS